MSSKLPITDRIAAEILHWFPKQAFSQGLGWASRLRVPAPLRRPVYGGFAWRYGIDLHELDRPLADFERFDDFFCRPLMDGTRTVAPGDDVLASPCDGVLSEHGLIDEGKCIQAKGIDYTLSGLLMDDAVARRFTGGNFATLYLAPKNYHRVHAPLSGQVTGYRHVPGARYPVNSLSVRSVPGLFCRNERLVTYLSTALGEVALVMVAATGVGHITVSYEPSLSTPAGGPDRGAAVYDVPKDLAKGAELGMFHLGSTVILLFESGRVLIDTAPGSAVRFGQPLGRKNPLYPLKGR